MIRVSLHPPRVTVFGHRVHHGLIGLVLLLHDRHDARVWLRDLIKHPHAR